MKISATKLRGNLFHFLDRVSKGEKLTIERKGRQIGEIIPFQSADWRKKIRIKPKLKVPQDKAFLPIEHLWEDYQ